MPRTTGMMTSRLTRSSGALESMRIIDPKSRLITPPALSSP